MATQPAHGTLTGTAPDLTYTPDAGYVGVDSFTFTASDGILSDTGTVAITVAAVVPGAPMGVTVVAGDGQVRVQWTAPASDGGSAITSSTITPSKAGVPQPPITVVGLGTSRVVTGLTNGTAHTFTVAATNAVGTGTPSAPSAAVTPIAPGAPYAPFASWSAFVKRQYVDLTTMQPTSSELNTWVTALGNSSKTKGDLADALRRGTENLANVDPVVRNYRAFLGRAPDATGLQFWIKRKRNVAPATTWNVTQIATEFTRSNEFTTKYGDLTNRQWVTQIYTDVLERPAEPSGVDYWTRQLDLKRKTKAQVMVGFSESSEYQGKQAENTDVAVAYTYLLGRAATTQETTTWVTRQQGGTSHADLLTELLESVAYRTHITG